MPLSSKTGALKEMALLQFSPSSEKDSYGGWAGEKGPGLKK